MSDRLPTDPGYLTPELNALRIQQLQQENDTLKGRNQAIAQRLEEMGRQLERQLVEMQQLKESRASQGKRLGTLEGEVSELKAMKKVLVVVGTVGLLGLGAYLKALFGG